MNNTIDMMAQLLEKTKIPLLVGARKKNGGSSLDNKERHHDLVVGSSGSSSFIIDSGASRHISSMKDFSWPYIFTLVHPSSWLMTLRS